jgi:hypothetical protein
MKRKPVNPLLPRPYNRMTAEELDREVERFDHELPAGKPLTLAEKARHRRAKRKMGRPVVGKGAERVTITMERMLLREADAYAKRMKISRSQMIAFGIKAMLKAG